MQCIYVCVLPLSVCYTFLHSLHQSTTDNAVNSESVMGKIQNLTNKDMSMPLSIIQGPCLTKIHLLLLSTITAFQLPQGLKANKKLHGKTHNKLPLKQTAKGWTTIEQKKNYRSTKRKNCVGSNWHSKAIFGIWSQITRVILMGNTYWILAHLTDPDPFSLSKWNALFSHIK